MQLRTAVIEDRFEGIDQASALSPVWPAGNRSYAYGSLFFDHLMARHGEDSMADFAEAVAGQWIPYRMNAAGRSAFGQSLSDAWREWGDSLGATYAHLDADLRKLGPITEPEHLTRGARWTTQPRVAADGTLAYAKSDGRSDPHLALRVVGDAGRADPALDADIRRVRVNGIVS